MLPRRIQVVCLAVGELRNEYVVRLESMLRRHMPLPFDLACASDRSGGFPRSIRLLDVGGWPPPRAGMRPTTYKLSLFDPARIPFEEFLYLDTSLVIHKDLSALLEFAFGQPHDLVAVNDWNYDTYNSSVMRIRQTEALAQIPRAYEAGKEFAQRVPGDQDFMTGVLRANGWEDRVTTFPEGMVQSYGVARGAAKRGWSVGRALLEEATIVKFHGPPKMHELLDPRYRLRTIVDKGNPWHRKAWFWVRELKTRWR